MYKRLLPYCLLIIACLFFVQVKAHTDTVRIGVNGLTCSSCSKAVEEKIIRLNFVQAVRMDLNSNEALVLVDFSKSPDWNKLATAVYDAGFSIGYLYVPSCGKRQVAEDACRKIYVYAGPPNQRAESGYYILIGKFFMSAKAYKGWNKQLKGMTYVTPENPVYYYY